MKRTVLAMSGGVDSSLAAHLLQRDGWEVVGVALALWGAKKSPSEGRAAPLAEDARSVCRMLGVEHRLVDCRNEFRQRVIEPFCEEYLSGRTPNPCVRGNRLRKFRALPDIADDLDADAVATGHYAIVERTLTGRIVDSAGRCLGRHRGIHLFALGQRRKLGIAAGEPLRSKSEVRVIFHSPESAITPGQVAVFYQGDVVLGSRTIDRVVTD